MPTEKFRAMYQPANIRTEISSQAFFIPTLIERTHSVRIDRAILVWGIVARLWETSSRPQHHVLQISLERQVVERTGPFDLT